MYVCVCARVCVCVYVAVEEPLLCTESCVMCRKFNSCLCGG